MVTKEQMTPGLNLVTEPDQLSQLVERLGRAKRIACDTEAASFHRYRDRVFLLQLSSDEETAIVDPLAFEDLAGVGMLLEDPSMEVVFHDADFDLRSLNRDYGWETRNIFDTRIAAQFLGEPGIGLGALLEKYFNLKVNKKFQRADWSKRPLDPEMLDYAAGDTANLLDLRDELERQLIDLKRIGWARDEFKGLEKLRWVSGNNGDGLGFLRIKGIRGFDNKALGVLKSLYDWREGEAARHDKPPFRIVGNEVLVAIARSNPCNEDELLQVGIPKGSVRRYGKQLVEASVAGQKQPFSPPKRERSRRRQPATADGAVDRLKEMRNGVAKDLGLEPGVLCPNGTLQAIARAAPRKEKDLEQISELRPWQISAMGSQRILKGLRA
jgi:ribonuclease D